MPTENGSATTNGNAHPTNLPVPAASLNGFPGLGAERQIEPRIARMEAEMETARSRGVWGLLRLRYEAWLEERMQGPAIAKMHAR